MLRRILIVYSFLTAYTEIKTETAHKIFPHPSSRASRFVVEVSVPINAGRSRSSLVLSTFLTKYA